MADQTFAVTVVASGGGNRYRFDGGSQDAETLELTEARLTDLRRKTQATQATASI